MLRTRSTSALALLAVLLVGCSMVIDVPADCTNVDCLPYVCAADGIECLDACASDAECGNGFLCDAESSHCEPTGCEPEFSAVELRGLPETISEFNVAVGGSPEQVMIVIGRPGGLGFRRFNANGEVVEDPPDPDLELVRLALENEDRLTFDPIVRYFDETDSSVVGGAPRFIVAWRVAQATRNYLSFGTFIISPPSAPSSQLSYESRARTEIGSVGFAPTGLGMITAWRAKSTSESLILARETDLAGAPTDEGDPILVSDEALVAAASAVVRAGDVQYVVYAMSGNGVRTIRALALDPSAETLGHVELLPDRPATTFDITSLDAVSAGDTGAAVWVEETGADTSVWAAMLDGALEQALDPELIISVPPLRLDRDFRDISTVRVASGSSTFSTAWFGTRAGRYDIWLTRYDSTGAPLFVPLAVTDNSAAGIDDFRIVSTSDGVGVLWLDEGTGDGPDRLFYRRYECAW